MVRMGVEFVKDAANSGCTPINITCPGNPVILPTPVPSAFSPIIFDTTNGTKADGPGSAVNWMVPRTMGCSKMPSLRGQGKPGRAICALHAIRRDGCVGRAEHPIVKRLLKGIQAKTQVGDAHSGEQRRRGHWWFVRLERRRFLRPLERIPRPQYENVIELLNGGLLLSTAQTVISSVVLPCSHVGSHLKMPLAVTEAPLGPEARRYVTGRVAALAVLVITKFCPTLML